MLENKNATFIVHEDDLTNLISSLYKWNIDVTLEKGADSLSFSVQSNNVLYKVEVMIFERFDKEEQLFMFNKYPHIKTFGDIQIKLFGKEIWNWR